MVGWLDVHRSKDPHRETGSERRGHPGARHFIEAILRDSIRADEFTEVLLPGEDNRPAVDGVRPSLFTALNIIDFTWLLNDVRCDSGAPVQFAFPPSAEVLP